MVGVSVKSVCCQDAHEMFHVLTETVAEEMTPTCRALTLFDVASLQVCNESQLTAVITRWTETLTVAVQYEVIMDMP